MTRILSLALPPAPCLLAAVAHAQTPTKPPAQAPAKPSAAPAFELRGTLDKKWTGDLDGMIKRLQRGIVYEVSQILAESQRRSGQAGQVVGRTP